MASITLKQLVKVYGSQVVVRGLDLEIPDKQFTVLVGPSGCGKSTTLRMIAGLESISSGQILMDGACVTDLPARDRSVAMVFQSYALYPHMTVRQNLEFSQKLRRVSKREMAKRVSDVASVLELEPLLGRKPAQLSGGQRQRVAMGRAIVREPGVFLFDEPLSNLDARLRHQMRIEIKRLQRRLTTTTVYVTHDQVEAMTLADVIVVMQDGAIAQAGAPLEVFEHPCNVFVAGFIGSPQMNFFEGTVAADCSHVGIANSDVQVPVSRQRFAFQLSGTRCAIVGFRPEDIVPERDGNARGSPAHIRSRVHFVENLGNETLLLSTVGNKEFVSRTNPSMGIVEGDVVSFRLNPARMHLFDADTKQSLASPNSGA